MRRKTSMMALMVILAVVVIAANRQSGPKQPIAFSHRIMAGQNKIDCQFCHPYPSRSKNAGMPSVDKCLLCHNAIPFGTGEIDRIRDYKSRNERIPWVRVNKVADFVRFNHECHIAGGHECEECHGDVSRMDGARPIHKFTMGFCVDCHRRNKASVDCFVCHY